MIASEPGSNPCCGCRRWWGRSRHREQVRLSSQRTGCDTKPCSCCAAVCSRRARSLQWTTWHVHCRAACALRQVPPTPTGREQGTPPSRRYTTLILQSYLAQRFLPAFTTRFWSSFARCRNGRTRTSTAHLRMVQRRNLLTNVAELQGVAPGYLHDDEAEPAVALMDVAAASRCAWWDSIRQALLSHGVLEWLVGALFLLQVPMQVGRAGVGALAAGHQGDPLESGIVWALL